MRNQTSDLQIQTIRRSEVRFLIGTQNFYLSHARDKMKNIFLKFCGVRE